MDDDRRMECGVEERGEHAIRRSNATSPAPETSRVLTERERLDELHEVMVRGTESFAVHWQRCAKGVLVGFTERSPPCSRFQGFQVCNRRVNDLARQSVVVCPVCRIQRLFVVEHKARVLYSSVLRRVRSMLPPVMIAMTREPRSSLIFPDNSPAMPAAAAGSTTSFV